MRVSTAVRPGPALGLVAQIALLALLGTGGAGWIAALAWAALVAVSLDRGLARAGQRTLGPADRVTLIRAVLVGAVAALVADSFTGELRVVEMVALCVVALVLDAVDGFVARITGTASPLGARFDMEVDAFLILVLSVAVARGSGAWVLLIGAARYLLWLAERAVVWLRSPVPPRQWRKTVAAIQGVTLTVAIAGVLPVLVMTVALMVALLLLAESFGRVAWWQWHAHHGRIADARHPWLGWAISGLAFALVWFALVAPNNLGNLTPSAFLRIPIEGLAVVAIAAVLPGRSRAAVLAVVGVALGALAVVKLLDMGFYAQLDRPFNPVSDWTSFGPAIGVVRDSVGHAWTVIIVAGALVLAAAIVVGTPLALLRVTRIARAHRRSALRTVAVLGAVSAVGALVGAPVASDSAGALAYEQVHAIQAAVQDEQTFGSMLAANDPYATAPASGLLGGLRGKDVIVAFVESYGRVAVQGSSFSPAVDAVLRRGTAQLDAAGFASRSAFLTSPTFGGISWLAHSTLQSGLWIDSQQRYDRLVASRRYTLSDAFRRAGWRTVGDVPSNGPSWPEGRSFYHYDKVYGATDVGYNGPTFSYASMPDQYVLSAFRRLELAKRHRRPVMAEIDLVSSHTPWAPLPRLVPWRSVGDGSAFNPIVGRAHSADYVWQSGDRVRAAYGQSIRYTLRTLISFVRTYRDPKLVLVVLGDHQPATVVTGEGASHDVPVSVIAHDPRVLARIAPWGWQRGLLPGPGAPVWPMDAFRDRFLAAFATPSAR